ncbi:MAG: LysM peptidoglycan-binding domain-containing protein [Armatimonadota bacterium]
MGEVNFVVYDPAEIRQFHCSCSTDAPVSIAASTLAQLARLPATDLSGRPIEYGFVASDIGLLGEDEPIGKFLHEVRGTIRLVPELVIASESSDVGSEPQHSSEDSPETFVVRVLEEKCVVHDEGLALPLDITIDSTAHSRIEEFATRDRTLECAGLLLGSVDIGFRRRVVHISGVVPAFGASECSSSVTLTLPSWENIVRARDREFSNLRILGWFHTHPGRDISFSRVDAFVHEKFFPHPNMVAYILDPVVGRSTFFCWRDGSIVTFRKHGLVGVSVVAPDAKTQVYSRKSRRGVALLSCGALFALIGGLLWNFNGGFILDKPKATSLMKKSSVTTSPASKLPVSSKSNRLPGDRIYVLRERDNLWFICRRFYGDGTLAPALARYNGIRTLTNLQIGQQIKIPPKQTLEAFRQ